MYVWGAGDGCWACVCPSVIMEKCCAINEKIIIDGVDSITQDSKRVGDRPSTKFTHPNSSDRLYRSHK